MFSGENEFFFRISSLGVNWFMGIGTKVIHCCNIFFLKRSKLICLKSRAPKGKAQSKFCLFLKIPGLYRSHQASYNFLSKRYSEQISWEMQLVQNMTKLDSLNSNTKVIDKCEGDGAPFKIRRWKIYFELVSRFSRVTFSQNLISPKLSPQCLTLHR